ncbi:hypothetical protein [Bacillus phage SP8]|nr:hypothetical protein [Bacillus phage SP8]
MTFKECLYDYFYLNRISRGGCAILYVRPDGNPNPDLR